jgi:hypothetical protein
MRIDEHGLESGIVVRLAMEKQDAGLRGDGDAYLVGDLESGATLEMFLGEKHLDMLAEFLPIRRRQFIEKRKVSLEDRLPFDGKLPPANPRSHKFVYQ